MFSSLLWPPRALYLGGLSLRTSCTSLFWRKRSVCGEDRESVTCGGGLFVCPPGSFRECDCAPHSQCLFASLTRISWRFRWVTASDVVQALSNIYLG